MIIYAETNFLLEIALLQEDHNCCQQLIALVQAHDSAQLVLPAFSFTESYDNLTRRSKRRKALVEQFRQQVQQMGRSAPYRTVVPEWEEVAVQLLTGSSDDWERLRTVNRQLVQLADIIVQDAEVIRTAMDYEYQFGLSPQDAVVYASVVKHLRTTPTGPKIFLNLNSRDFNDPDIVQELDGYGCKMLFKFSAGLGYASSLLK